MLQQFNEKNRDLVVNINGRLVHRDEAGVSPFDSAVQGGDAVWEGLRLYNGRIFKLHEHLDRLERSAHDLSIVDLPPREKIIEELKRTVEHFICGHGVFELFDDLFSRCENYFRYGPAIEPERRDPDRSGRA